MTAELGSMVSGAPVALVNWRPAVSVALVGALIALGPLALVWRQQRARGAAHWARALTLATLVLTLDLVVFGAFTRLTDSGLGCPDWPGCYGSTSPVGAHAAIAQEVAEAPHGPVTHRKAWIEMIHRYLATGVGALITCLMALAWWQRRQPTAQTAAAHLSPWWATATFVWVCVQGLFGALTVTLKLYPLVVTGHLLGGLLGVALLTAQVRALSAPAGLGLWHEPVPAGLRRAALGVCVLWFVQVALGGWVSTNGAVLACEDFPTCHGQWWPAADWSTALTLMRPLGTDGQGGAISLQALTAIHLMHRLGAVVATAAVLALAWRCWSHGHSTTRRDARWLLGLLAWQVLSGMTNVVLDWPLLAALAHTTGAALMVAFLTRMAVQPSGLATAPSEARAPLPLTPKGA